MSKKEKVPEEELKAIYLDILNGYSLFESDKFGTAFIKHLSTSDVTDLDKEKKRHEKVVSELDIPSQKEQEELLDKEGIWTKEDKIKIDELSLYIKNLQETKSRCFLHSQKMEIAKEIEKKQFELSKCLAEREEYMGHTAEKYVDKKVNEYYANHILYKDADFKEHKWSMEEWEELTDEETMHIISLYGKSTRGLSSKIIKKVALSGFFTNIFYMCDNNPYYFYGKPIINLTYFQSELFSYGMYFKHLMTDSKVQPPEEIMNDPDALQEWYETGKNAEELLEKLQDKDAVSIVGATKDDLKRLGLDSDKDPNLTSLSKEAAKRGGTLTMEDFIEIHGD